MVKLGAIKRYTRKGVTTLKNEGVVELGIKSLQKIKKVQNRRAAEPAKKVKFVSLVDRENVMKADWSRGYKPKKNLGSKRPYTVSWIMSPPGGGGGHQNIFRFINYLDTLGHKNNVYLYSTLDDMTISQAKDNVSAYCNAKNLTIKRYKGSIDKSDVLFATGWETAYPVFNDKSDARKMYFVQDFEPLFYSMGTNYVLAENTYKFGFHGITAGGWLSDKLSKDYGMTCDHYDFGADANYYKHQNHGERKEIFFYARPVTERRGFDLGIMALELFHKEMPDYKIHLAGWDVAEYDVPFPYVNHKAVPIKELANIYNKSAAALVLSLTNMSLLPLELLACGTIPVVNDGPNNRLVSNNPYIKYTDASPRALADALIDIVKRKDLPNYAREASGSVKGASWDKAGAVFMEAIDKELGRG